MNNRPIDKSKLTDDIFKATGGAVDRNSINAAANGDASKLLAALNEKDREKINKILNDPEKLSKILNNDAAKSIINKLSGGKKNG